jgi:hypothetical protein
MTAKKGIEELLSELEKLKKIIIQYDDPGLIPKIERDILLTVMRGLYEEILALPVSTRDIEEPKKTATPQKEPSETEKEQEETGKEQEERIEFVDEKPSDESAAVKTPQIEEINEAQKKDVEQTKRTEEKQKEKTKILAEKFQSDRQYIYESLSEKTPKQNVSTKIQSKPISNIAASIGVNDKFKLIRDLFNGDAETYRKTIEILNNSTNFNDAFNYITTNFNWDMEDESVQFILDLVRRKFIVDKQ